MMVATFKQYLINEGEVKAEADSSGLSSQLKQIINQFLLPVADDKQEFRKRTLLGREVIHTIEDAVKSAIGKDGFDSAAFKTDAKNAVLRILNPPASEEKDRDKYPTIASSFNNKVVGYVNSKLKSADKENVKDTASSLMGGVGETWNDLSRRASNTEDRGEEKQMSRRYDQDRKRGGKATRRQTYKNVKMRAARGSK